MSSGNLLFSVAAIDPAPYEAAVKSSWVWDELYRIRNVRPSFNTRLGAVGGMFYTGVINYIMRGKEPWTFSHGGAARFSSRVGYVEKFVYFFF